MLAPWRILHKEDLNFPREKFDIGATTLIIPRNPQGEFVISFKPPIGKKLHQPSY